jgi:hypothetical protein
MFDRDTFPIVPPRAQLVRPRLADGMFSRVAAFAPLSVRPSFNRIP